MKEQTVSLGTKIVAANEKLTSINMIDLFEMIAHPEPSLRNQTDTEHHLFSRKETRIYDMLHHVRHHQQQGQNIDSKIPTEKRMYKGPEVHLHGRHAI